ncbi:SNF2 family N-terminal domain-containing protein, partial [Piptocephalis cylindrospora]
GILAEEMGLGKTIEMLSLIVLHPKSLDNARNAPSTLSLLPSNATLIATPSTIQNQWVSECNRHVPSLHIATYQGIPKSHSRDQAYIERETTRLAQADIVLVSYDVLRREVHYARPPSQMVRRGKISESRIPRPLLSILWWRVCLDEAQMVEGGVSTVSEMACAIPRIHRWAISGTPFKHTIGDIRQVLLFLQ